jgi:sugar phosphate permease
MNNIDTMQKFDQKFKKYSWMTLLGFALTYAFVYNGRFNLEIALPLMKNDLGLSKIEIGIIASTIYWGYACGNFINGRLGEILGPKKFIMAGIILTILTNWIVSLSNSSTMIAILWCINGYFQSMIWAPGMSLLSRWWPSNKRGFAAGFAHSFSGLAHIVLWASVIVTFKIVHQREWRELFRIPVSFLLIISMFYWIMVNESPKDVGLMDYEEIDQNISEKEKLYRRLNNEKGKLFPYKCLFSQWRFCIWCIISALASICRYGLLTWIPLYFAEQMDIQIRTGIFDSLMLPLGMAMGTFIVPWSTDRLFGKNRSPAVIIFGALSALMVFIFPSMKTATTVTIALFWSGFFLYGINGVLWPYSIDVGTRVFAGTAAGILDWAAYMGAAVQAMVFGFILQITNKWEYVFVSIAILCIVMVVLAIIVDEQRPTSII